MPIDPRRRDEIAAAVAAYDHDHPDAPLPRNAAQISADTWHVHQHRRRPSQSDKGR
jgi:hypothetical protein